MSSWSSWKNHVPNRAVQLHLAGRNWTGQVQVEGRDLVVASAYGSRRRAIGRRKRDLLAAEMMREILVDYCHGTPAAENC